MQWRSFPPRPHPFTLALTLTLIWQVGHYYGEASAYAAGARRVARHWGGDSEGLVGGGWVPRWLHAATNSLRWFAVTPPTFLFWHALSVELSGSCAWRRLLLPVLLFAAQERGGIVNQRSHSS